MFSGALSWDQVREGFARHQPGGWWSKPGESHVALKGPGGKGEVCTGGKLSVVFLIQKKGFTGYFGKRNGWKQGLVCVMEEKGSFILEMHGVSCFHSLS